MKYNISKGLIVVYKLKKKKWFLQAFSWWQLYIPLVTVLWPEPTTSWIIMDFEPLRRGLIIHELESQCWQFLQFQASPHKLRQVISSVNPWISVAGGPWMSPQILHFMQGWTIYISRDHECTWVFKPYPCWVRTSTQLGLQISTQLDMRKSPFIWKI